MRINLLSGLAAATALVASPIAAAPAFAAKPSAAPLSVTAATGQRAATRTTDANAFGGPAVYAALVVAGIAAILIIAGTNNDDADSN